MRSFIASAVLALAALPSVLAAPAAQAPGRGIQPPFKFSNCSVSALPPIPAGAAIAVSSGLKTHFVGLGVGTQNYTCSADGKYVSAGAVAKLYDVSCFVGKSLPKPLSFPDEARKAKFDPESVALALSPLLGAILPKLGDHYFIKNTAGGISPLFDFTASQKQSAVVVAAKKAGIPSPDGSDNVDWLQLTKVNGTMGAEVFRVDTRKGQPPTSCTPGSAPIKVPYSAMYWVMDA